MMTGFFAAYSDVNWSVEANQYSGDSHVEFEFQMTATDPKANAQFVRKGLESMQFTEDGYIQSITVTVKS